VPGHRLAPELGGNSGSGVAESSESLKKIRHLTLAKREAPLWYPFFPVSTLRLICMRTVPLYKKIADELYERIRSGTYPLGEDLPIEAHLCEEFQASHHTVRDAMRILIEKGLVVRRAGSGTKVIATKEPTVFSHSVGNLQQLIRYPESTYRENLATEHIVADPYLASLLACDLGTPWYRIRAVRRTDPTAKPICWTDFYLLPRHAGVVKLKDHLAAPVYDQIERLYGDRVERARIDILASRVSAEQAGPLQVVEDTPAITLIRRYADANDNVFEVTVSVHPEGRYMYSLDFKREIKRR
jgi:GntR family transcriptional regulator